MSLTTDLTTAVNNVVADSALFAATIHGPATGPGSTVDLGGGVTTPTLAAAVNQAGIDAAAAAGSAQTSATNAAASEADALASKNNAATYESETQTSRDNAATYEGEAQTSRDNAATYEGQALTAKNNTQAHEAAALTAKNNTETYEGQASALITSLNEMVAEMEVAPPGAFPTDSQVMTGASPQAGVKGGVNAKGSFYIAAGIAFESATMLVRNVDSSGAERNLMGSAGVATGGWHLYAQGVVLKFGEMSDGSVQTIGNLPTGAYFLTINHTPSTRLIEAYVNGVLLGSITRADTNAMQPVSFIAGRWYDGLNPLYGDVVDVKFINRSVTTDEIKACNKGEIPAELARQAGVKANGIFDGNYTGTTGGFTASGGGFVIAAIGVPLNAGDSLRIKYSCTVAGYALHLRASDGSYASALHTTVSGANEVVLTATKGCDGVVFDSLSSGTVSGYSNELLGTVEHFAADKVRSTGRWQGKFGTFLEPGAGITALDPEPIQARPFKFRYDMTTNAAIDTLPTGWTANRTATGVLRITPPAHAITIDRPSIGGSVSGDNFPSTDYDADPTYINFNVKSVGTTPAAANAKVAITGSFRE